MSGNHRELPSRARANHKGLLSRARANHNRLLRAARARVLQFLGDVSAIVLTYLEELSDEAYSKAMLGVARGDQSLAVDIYYIEPGMVGVHVAHSPTWKCVAKRGRIKDLNDIGKLVYYVSASTPEDCDFTGPMPVPRKEVLNALVELYVRHINDKIAAFESRPMLA